MSKCRERRGLLVCDLEVGHDGDEHRDYWIPSEPVDFVAKPRPTAVEATDG